MNQFPTKSLLSGADWFMLAMEPHMTLHKPVGNVCRFALLLKGRLTEEEILKKFSEKSLLGWLGSLRLNKGFFYQLPQWEPGVSSTGITINRHESAGYELPDRILERNISIEDQPHFQFDLIDHTDGKTTFVFSWHHVLMDGRGAGMLLRLLNLDHEPDDYTRLSPVENPAGSMLHNWNNMMVTKEFLKASSRKPLATFYNGVSDGRPVPHYRVLKFTREETTLINENATKHGVRYGHSPFYLGATVRAAHQLLKERGCEDRPFWVPVPQDERLRGATGPLITNQLSFIFYRIPVLKIKTLKDAVEEITRQMVDQIRDQVPRKYARMMDWFRRMPLKPYYQLIKGPAGGSLASFLFSVAADSPDEFRTFLGHDVEDAVNFPPNTYPPGFTVVFMRFHGTLKIIVAYVEPTITTEEVIHFEELIRQDLMKGDFR